MLKQQCARASKSGVSRPALPEFVRFERRLTDVQEGGFIVGNRPAEGGERGRQDLDSIEIAAHGIERAMQLALHSIYGGFHSHSRFIRGSRCRFYVNALACVG